MLTIKNVSKSYAKSNVRAVDNLSLELNKGEIFGFLGPNGAGKTTTIKMVTGILNPNEGEILVNGLSNMLSPTELKRHIGYVADSSIVYDKLTGKEYIDFLADVYGISTADRQARTEKMLKLFALEQAFNSPINTYSHGMKQKISIIGALIHNPALWVLDEPLTGLDPQSAFVLKNLMREHCDNGNTVFFSTHVLEVAEKLCDRVGIIANGRLVKVLGRDELKNVHNDKSLEQVFLSLVSKEGE